MKDTIHRIAKLANDRPRKTKKNEAFYIINTIANEIEGHDDALAELYKYFMPSVPRKAKDAFQYVEQAALGEKILHVKRSSPSSPWHIKTELGEALIMPARI